MKSRICSSVCLSLADLCGAKYDVAINKSQPRSICLHLSLRFRIAKMLSSITSSLKGVSTLTFLFRYALWTGLALLTWRLISNRRRLSSIPGPFLASISDLWRFYQHLNGRVPEALENQHKKLGSLVRWGTNNISVSDPEAIHIIYGIHPVFNKVRISFYLERVC